MTSPDPDAGADLVFAGGVADDLFSRAHEGVPAEVCGVIGGHDDQVTVAEAVPNVAAAPETRYELDPAATLAAIETVEEAGEHLGFYHSHPRGPPAPSATDEAEATWTGYVYCIVSVPEERLDAWRWTGDRFERLTVAVDRE